MTETTDPLDAHGMTMDGEPAMPILVAEYNALVSRVNEAEARAAVPSAPITDRAALVEGPQTVTHNANDLRRKLASSDRIRENADFHLGQEMARRQLAEKETARLRAVVARLRQMTDHWEQQLPEVIRTPAVVSAIRAVLEAADEAQQPTPCDQPNACDADTGELCATHEEEQAHAEGEHEYCGVTCGVQFPSEEMRNFVVAKGYPGTAGMLDELLQRAATGQLPAVEARQADTAGEQQ